MVERARAAFGDRDAWLAIVGLAPGKHGANRTGRPFTGDFAGELLYTTLLKFRLAEGEYKADPADGLQLKGAVILNAVKCLPPANKPEPREIATCRSYFEVALGALPNVRVVVALGQSPMSPQRDRWACHLRPRNLATVRKRSVPTAGYCCRVITAPDTTRTLAV